MNPALRIVALMPDAYGGFGGIAQYNRDFLDAACESSAVDTVVSLTRHAPDDSGYSLSAKTREYAVSGNSVRYALAAAHHARKLRPHLILCGHFNLLPVAAILKRLARVPILLEAYGIEAWQRESSIRMFSIKQADMVVSISRFTRAQLIR